MLFVRPVELGLFPPLTCVCVPFGSVFPPVTCVYVPVDVCLCPIGDFD